MCFLIKVFLVIKFGFCCDLRRVHYSGADVVVICVFVESVSDLCGFLVDAGYFRKISSVIIDNEI